MSDDTTIHAVPAPLTRTEALQRAVTTVFQFAHTWFDKPEFCGFTHPELEAEITAGLALLKEAETTGGANELTAALLQIGGAAVIACAQQILEPRTAI